MIDEVTDDDPTPEQLERLARSIAMSGNLGDRDRRDVIDALRRLAEIDKATRRQPTSAPYFYSAVQEPAFKADDTP
jgi:hypothetical protein